MSVLPYESTFVADLGGGLICRWSTGADQDRIGRLLGTVHRRSAEDSPNLRSADVPRIMMGDGFPYMGPGDYAIVEDTSRPDRPVVACTCLWRHVWRYAEVAFGVGQPEMVATDAAYRHRGLVRSLFAMVHARSAAEGHLVQGITGIAYFYRQFGYEYVLDLEGRRFVSIGEIPPTASDEPEPYGLRAAALDDVPQIMALYDQGRRGSLIWREAPAAFWQHHIAAWDHPHVRARTPTQVGLNARLYMVVDGAGQAVGYVWLAAKRWGSGLEVSALELAPHVNWQAVAPSLLRALRAYGQQLPAVREDTPPFREISFILGRSHPFYTVLGDRLAPRYEPPYAWYLRVVDVPAFLRHIAPVLEARLAQSLLPGLTGSLKIDFYRSGLQLRFDRGKMVAAEPWRAPDYGDIADAGCPPTVFLQLLFGYRSLADLRAMFPDVWASGTETALLIDTLFPALPSTVHELSGV